MPHWLSRLLIGVQARVQAQLPGLPQPAHVSTAAAGFAGLFCTHRKALQCGRLEQLGIVARHNSQGDGTRISGWSHRLLTQPLKQVKLLPRTRSPHQPPVHQPHSQLGSAQLVLQQTMEESGNVSERCAVRVVAKRWCMAAKCVRRRRQHARGATACTSQHYT